ncbi:MAG: glycosyltransferase [Candidatus Diapherotrites archaeon]|nr:glycosyltransferase [Candidatus Diapherotrites archaeon]
MKASVIIPAFNAEKTLRQCLESTERQEFRGEFEIIVVDDGSTDSTIRIAGEFKKVRVVKQKHAGPAVGRDNGAKHAKGGIIIFVDSDCIADKNWLAEMLAPFGNKEVAGVQGIYKCRQKELIARMTQLEIEERYIKMAKSKYIDFIGSYSAGYRKSVFEEMKGFDTSFPMASGEDTDLSFRIHAAGYKMVFNKKAFVYHTHPTTLKKYLKVKFYRAFWRTKIYKKHMKKMAGDSYTSQVMKAQIALFYLLALALLATPLLPGTLFYAGGIFLLFILSTIPFALWAARRDSSVAAAAPFLTVLRTAAFCTGFACGTIKQVAGKK